MRKMIFLGLPICLAMAFNADVANAAEDSNLRLGGRFVLSPTGSLGAGLNGSSIDADTEVAYGARVQLGYQLNPYFSIAFAPQVIFNVKGEGASDSATEYDLFVRGTLHLPVAQNLELYGFAEPGYAIINVPEGNTPIDNPTGFVLGFGGGAAFALSEKVQLVGELGYQLGFQGTEVLGTDIDFDSRFFNVGVGLNFLL